MKKSIILVLLYLMVQAIVAFVITTAFNVYSNNANALITNEWPIIVTLLAADFVMAGILLQRGYLSHKRLWNPTNVHCLWWTVVAGTTAIFITDAISSVASFLPNWLEGTFNNIEGNLLGIIAVAIIGPILEEMLFRGVITTELLKAYPPKKAIITSAIIFGVFHLNPAQILVATLLGLLLGWLFYKTHSMIPGIIVHILNNSSSVFFTQTYPNAENFYDLLGLAPYIVCLAIAILLLAYSIKNLA